MTESTAVKGVTSEKQLERGTWGAFFLWIGIALLASLPWGIWMLGVGVIILGAQVSRPLIALRVEAFWIAVGGLFLIGGISELAKLELNIALIPILCIVVGVGLLAHALPRRSVRATHS